MAELGDLSDFLKEGSVSDLKWLEIDDAEYRAGEIPGQGALPKQNLDISPDLVGLWARDDKPTTSYLVPNKQVVKPFPGAGEVHTMGDLSQAHGKLRDRAEDIAKITRYAMMQSTDSSNLKRLLTARFDLPTLQANRDVIASVLQERGLLGPVYIQASDFPNCAQSPKNTTTFVRRFACDAKYIVAKPECSGCIHAKKVGGTTNCSVFHKQIVLNVPYTDQLAAEVEQLQQTRGKVIQASSNATPRERVRLAMLAEAPQMEAPVYKGVGENQLPKPAVMPVQESGERLIQASSLTRKRDEKLHLELKSKPIIAFVRRELLKGRTAAELASSLKVSFPLSDLAETRAEWEPYFKEAGLLGAVYSTQDSFEDCHEGADFLAKHNPGVRAMVAGSKCESCIYNKISRCMLYGKPLVKAASDLYTWDTVEAVLLEHKNAGRIPAWEKSASLGTSDPRSALKSIHDRVSSQQGKPSGTAERMDLFYQWAGGPRQEHVASGTTKRNIVKTASKYMNEGLYGKDLLRALKTRYEVRDLAASKEDLKSVIAEQGLQGIYYVNPSVYDDYGHGCEEVSRLFRAKQVPYAKLGDKCGSCVHNHNMTCSKLNKPLVVEPPYVDKSAQQQAILASGPSTQSVDPASILAPSGMSVITEYQLQNHGMDIELNEPVKTASFDIVLGRTRVKV
jgi:hypothetical protein